MLAAIVFTLFVFLGAYLLISSLSKLHYSKKVARWPTVTGTIKEVYDKDWVALENADPKADPLQLRYYYSYKGKLYHNFTLGVDYSAWVGSQNKSLTIVIQDIASLLQHLRENPEVTVWVNPENPSESFLLLQQRGSVFLSLVGACLMIWGISIGYFLSDIKVINISDQVIVKELKSEEEIQEMEIRQLQEMDSTGASTTR